MAAVTQNITFKYSTFKNQTVLSRTLKSERKTITVNKFVLVPKRNPEALHIPQFCNVWVSSIHNFYKTTNVTPISPPECWLSGAQLALVLWEPFVPIYTAVLQVFKSTKSELWEKYIRSLIWLIGRRVVMREPVDWSRCLSAAEVMTHREMSFCNLSRGWWCEVTQRDEFCAGEVKV